MKRVLTAAIAVWLIACVAGSVKDEPLDRRRCSAIEVLPAGISPAHRYRVLGPVTTDDNNPEQALRESACRLGANAVVDFRRDMSGAPQSVGGTSSAVDARVTSSGTAVVYTDLPDAGS